MSKVEIDLSPCNAPPNDALPWRRRADGRQRRQPAGAIGLGPLLESAASSERGLGCTAGQFIFPARHPNSLRDRNKFPAFLSREFDWKYLDSRRILLLFVLQAAGINDFPAQFPVRREWRFGPHARPVPEVNNGGTSGRWGYGFSYVFHRRVWEAVRFPNQDHDEDQIFADAAIARFKSAGKQDFACSCLHVIHTTNGSNSFPQQILPSDLLPQLFPKFPIRSATPAIKRE